MTEIKPGTFGLAIIGGKTGKLVRWGQAFVEGQDYTFTHAFLVLDNEQVIEAEPGGAKIAPLSKYTSREAGLVLFCDEPVLNEVFATTFGQQPYADNLEAHLRERIVDFARTLEGVPYNYLDYLAIGLDRFGIRPKFIRNRLARHDRLICSQLVDFVYLAAGIHLFSDGRDSQEVTPGDLEHYARDYA